MAKLAFFVLLKTMVLMGDISVVHGIYKPTYNWENLLLGFAPMTLAFSQWKLLYLGNL
jgi:hypothetical protein